MLHGIKDRLFGLGIFASVAVWIAGIALVIISIITNFWIILVSIVALALGCAFFFALIWLVLRLLGLDPGSKGVMKQSQNPSTTGATTEINNQSALEKHIERKVNEQIQARGLRGFLVFSPWHNYAVRYYYESHIDDEVGRRHEVREKVILHAQEYQEFQDEIQGH